MKMNVHFEGKKKVIAQFQDYKVVTDQPILSGGDASAPSPFEIFLSSLATCAGIYVKGFCDNRELPTNDITLEQEIIINSETRVLEKISIKIFLPNSFPDKYDDAIINVASLCLVKKQLKESIKFEITIERK